MLKVVTGRFHPCLEAAFVEQLQHIKAGDTWARVAIVVPSTPILHRLRRLLAVDHRLSLLNVYLLTFHQLALRLAEELRATGAPLRIVDELFFVQLVRRLVEQQLADSRPLQQLGQSFGTWAALWSTIRDLKDGGVDPVTAVQALREGCFGREDQEWLHALFSLQATVQQVSAGLNVGTADDLVQSLVPAVPASPFLASLSHLCYYGFYDLTQVQLSLFQAVSACVATTLFFPLENDASFVFAKRFHDRHIQPLLGSDPPVDLEVGETHSPELLLQSVSGPEEELSVTCRTILDLVETHGYRFDEIGVVARTLDPYSTVVQTIFDRHRVPMTTTARRPLIHQPLCKTLLLLAVLPVNDFYRGAVLDIVTSPFYAKFALPNGRSLPAYRPEQWRAIVQALNITHGLDEWRRLEQCCESALELGGGEEVGAIGPFKVTPEVIALLWDTVSRLLTSYQALPSRGGYGTLLQAFRRLVDEHFRPPRDDREESSNGQPTALTAVWEAIDETVNRLAALELLGNELTWAEFTEMLTHAFEHATVSLQTASQQGVLVLDAMAARGLPFKALFVLGLNEKVFPRYIREDPFLRDRHRRVLETTLGYKLDEKLPGYDEEVLLFALLRQAATRRLYLSFQRADAGGRMLGPSPYFSEARQRLGMPAQPVQIIPRRMTERVAQRPETSRFLPPTDLAQWMAVSGRDCAGLLEATGKEVAMFRDGMQALARTEDEQPTLTPFDGSTGPLETHWAGVVERGIAPTPLERYARCPFRYFSADVLRLTPVRVPTSDELDARVLGTFCHGALRRCYEMLLLTGWPAHQISKDTIAGCIKTAVKEAAGEVERQHRTGHFLLWEMAKAQIAEVMARAVEDDTRAYHDVPFAPIAFEVLAEGAIADIPGQGTAPLKIRGRIDRLDRHRQSGELRIIDYKLKLGKSIASEDRQLMQSAIRGYRLQPPLYARLQIPGHGALRQVQLFFLGPSWSSPIVRSSFDPDVWSANSGRALHKTLGRLMDGIRKGQFFIMPDAYCATCEYRVACRREHAPTWWRASRAGESKELAALRTLRVDNERC